MSSGPALVARLQRLRALAAAGQGVTRREASTHASNPDVVVRMELKAAQRNLGLQHPLGVQWFSDHDRIQVEGFSGRVMGFVTCGLHDLMNLHQDLRTDLPRLRWTIHHEAKHCQLHQMDKRWCGPWTPAQEAECDAYATLATRFETSRGF